MARKVLILGAGRGVGRAAAAQLAAAGHSVVAVARTQSDLTTLAAETANISTEACDAATDGTIASLLERHAPDVVLQIGGLQPKIAFLSAYDWAEFSAPWESDTKMSFELAQAALTGALPKGGSVVAVASGAALNGSPLSGGYAGAKRMQHFIMNYAQIEADKRELGLTFATVYPKQLIAGTDIANQASAAYGKMRGGDAASFMSQWNKPLTPDAVASHMASLVSAPQSGTFGVDGAGMVSLN